MKPRGWAVAVINHKAGLMTNKKLRQGFQAALEMEPIMLAGFGSKEFYRLDPGLFFPEQAWHSTASANLYNQKDKAKARRLVQEAGYAKQPIRWITTKEYEFMYKNALVARQQLEEVGFVVDVQVVDWATLNSRTQKPELWEVFSTGFVFSADPANHVALRCTFQGWWCNEEKEKLLADLRLESDVKKRKAIVDRIQTLFYEDVGSVKPATISPWTSPGGSCAASFAPRPGSTSGTRGWPSERAEHALRASRPGRRWVRRLQR